MDNDLAIVVSNFVYGVVFFCVGFWRGRKQRKHQYQWGCPNCIFRVESNNSIFTLKMADAHERECKHG